MLILISYDLKCPGRDYTALYESIKSLGEWWHYLGSVWIIKSDRNVTQIAQILRTKIDENDLLFVVDITGKPVDGWLPRAAWEWMKK